MVVDTSYTKSSGPSGGTRMFSRVGKQTVAEEMTFQDGPAVEVDSKLPMGVRARRYYGPDDPKAGGTINEEDDEELAKYDMADLGRNGGKEASKTKESAATADAKSPTKPSNLNSKKAEMAKQKAMQVQMLMGNQKQTLHGIFEKLNVSLRN